MRKCSKISEKRTLSIISLAQNTILASLARVAETPKMSIISKISPVRNISHAFDLAYVDDISKSLGAAFFTRDGKWLKQLTRVFKLYQSGLSHQRKALTGSHKPPIILWQQKSSERHGWFASASSIVHLKKNELKSFSKSCSKYSNAFKFAAKLYCSKFDP